VKRTRYIAASPVRSASATWATVRNLVLDTLASSAALSSTDVTEALAVADGVGRMLVAGGHLNQQPLTLVAGKIHLEISTVTGRAALALDENLGPVPGTTNAADFTIYLPTPAPLEDAVRAAVAEHPRLSDAVAPADGAAVKEYANPLVDLAALRRLGEDR
jgi:hypothetical protein